MLFLRNLIIFAGIVIALVCSTRSAHADQLTQTSAIWKPLPPDIDTAKSGGVKGLFDKIGRSCFKVPFTMQERAMRERVGGAIGQEQQTSLGARSQGLSMLGLSGAGVGAVTWVIVHAGGNKPTLSLIPRLFGGGGGLALTIRW